MHQMLMYLATIRVHSPETLTAQETYKSERAQAVKESRIRR